LLGLRLAKPGVPAQQHASRGVFCLSSATGGMSVTKESGDVVEVTEVGVVGKGLRARLGVA